MVRACGIVRACVQKVATGRGFRMSCRTLMSCRPLLLLVLSFGRAGVAEDVYYTGGSAEPAVVRRNRAIFVRRLSMPGRAEAGREAASSIPKGDRPSEGQRQCAGGRVPQRPPVQPDLEGAEAAHGRAVRRGAAAGRSGRAGDAAAVRRRGDRGSIFSKFSGHADGDRRGPDRIGG